MSNASPTPDDPSASLRRELRTIATLSVLSINARATAARCGWVDRAAHIRRADGAAAAPRRPAAFEPAA